MTKRWPSQILGPGRDVAVGVHHHLAVVVDPGVVVRARQRVEDGEEVQAVLLSARSVRHGSDVSRPEA